MMNFEAFGSSFGSYFFDFVKLNNYLGSNINNIKKDVLAGVPIGVKDSESYSIKIRDLLNIPDDLNINDDVISRISSYTTKLNSKRIAKGKNPLNCYCGNVYKLLYLLLGSIERECEKCILIDKSDLPYYYDAIKSVQYLTSSKLKFCELKKFLEVLEYPHGVYCTYICSRDILSLVDEYISTMLKYTCGKKVNTDELFCSDIWNSLICGDTYFIESRILCSIMKESTKC